MSVLKKYWWFLVLALIAAIASYYIWRSTRPPWHGIPCAKGWKRPKWDFAMAWVESEAEGDIEAAGYVLESMKESPFERTEMDKKAICEKLSRSHFLQKWEEKRYEMGLAHNGRKLKEGEKWTYQGPISCLKGFEWDRFQYIRSMSIEGAVGLMARSGSTKDPEDMLEGAEWLWYTAGDKEWAKKFGSDTHSIKGLCRIFNGKDPETGDDNWRPDYIGHTEGVEDLKGYNLPKEMGGGPPGSYMDEEGVKKDLGIWPDFLLGS